MVKQVTKIMHRTVFSVKDIVWVHAGKGQKTHTVLATGSQPGSSFPLGLYFLLGTIIPLAEKSIYTLLKQEPFGFSNLIILLIKWE